MKKLVLAAVIGFGTAGLASADPAAGIWQTEKADDGAYLYVSIKPCGSAICGTINTAFDSSGNKSPDYANLGKKMIWDMVPDGGGAYSGGKIWAPDSDKTYSSKMSLSGNTLTVKGCVAGGLICRGQDWKRVK